jgi:diguanylate cyclase (GGDEF)-like protein
VLALRQLALLQQLADLAAGRLDHVTATNQRTETDHLLATVAAASRAILVAEHPGSELCRWACRLVEASAALLLEPDDDEHVVVTAAANAEASTARISMHEPSIMQSAIATRRLQLINDYRHHSDVTPELKELLEAADPGDATALALLPLTAAHKTTAVLAVLLRGRITAARADLLGLVRILGAEAGLAIERDHLRRLLELQARTDELTGLANRRTWQERLDLEIARAARTGTPLCLLTLDLDHFKDYNDAHGHPAGDQLLRDTVWVWLTHIRETDLLARLGGEEFGLLLPDTPLEPAALLGERLLRHMPSGSTASAGLAIWHGDDADVFFRRADEALYAAKAAGRDQLTVAAYLDD